MSNYWPAARGMGSRRSLLYKSGTYYDDDGEGTFTLVELFVYEFVNYNELGLETTSFSVNRYSGYRRVKQQRINDRA